MSRVQHERWMCDQCRLDGGAVDGDELIPFRWLSLDVLVGTPQLESEKRPRRLHLCAKCASEFIISLVSDTDDVARIKTYWRRDENHGRTGRIGS